MAEIEGSRELGGSQDESLGVGCSKSRVEKSRGERIVVGSRSREDRWIRSFIARITPSEVRRLRKPLLDIRIHEVPRAEARVWAHGRTSRWSLHD